MGVDTSPAAAGYASGYKPKHRHHDMKATWHKGDSSQWNFPQRFLMRRGVIADAPGKPEVPVFKPTDKVKAYPVWKQQVWIFPRAVIPIVIHYAWMKLTGRTLHPVAAFFLYAYGYKAFGLASVRKFNKLAYQYGYFDGQEKRDGVPDSESWRVWMSMVLTITGRPMLGLMLAYNRHEVPSLSWWFPVQLAAYCTVLDFWFYIYHRLFHDVNRLWTYHRTHHITKHPNALLSAFADEEQEFFDIVIIPLLTYMVMPVNFSTWFLCTQVVLYTEAMGHSGVRLYWQTPGPSLFLRPLGMELTLEDHDLHHRKGYRSSANYGKQTRVWDVLFGTTRDRIETKEDNIDWTDTPW